MKRVLFLGCVFSLFLVTRNFAQDAMSKEAVIKALEASNDPKAVALRSEGIEFNVKDGHTEESFGVDHVYLQQTYKGIIVYNVVQSLAFKNNQLQYASGNFINDITKKAPSSKPAIDAAKAIDYAANYLGLGQTNNLEVVSNTFTTDNKIVYNTGGIAKSNIKTELVWVSNDDGKTVHLAWNVTIEPTKGSDYWHVRVDAANGAIINKGNYTVYENNKANLKRDHSKEPSIVCYEREDKTIATAKTKFMAPPPPPPTVTSATYTVIAYPNENVWTDGYTPENDPWNLAGANNKATTYGWHYDGTTNYKMSFGNNTHTYDDSLNINKPGRPDTSTTAIPTLTFNFIPNLQKDPTLTQNRQFGEANLFYWNNIMHDISYQYGFNESAGNFQQTNTFNAVNRGGKAGDPVFSEAQDGSGTDNSNFSAPPDGQSGRMQMYLFGSNAAAYVTIKTPSSIAGNYQYIESDFSTANKLANVGAVTGTFALFNDDASGATHYACSGAPYNNIKGKIALIDRNNCNFTVKVKAAQTAGAIAVVMVNRVDSLLTMGGSDNTITIPAVLVEDSDGVKMEAAVAAGQNVTGTITPLTGVRFDGDIDNTIVSHEFTHGISLRLTGGPSTTSCLDNKEEAGEGWSDYNALMSTTDWSAAQLTDGSNARTIGSYAWDQTPNTGTGVRTVPYSTDTSIDPHTYQDVGNPTYAGEVHYIGEVWCSALWDMTWDIIQQEGTINANLYDAAPGGGSGTGGNVIALQLVIEGLKLQPCSPGFIDARNAILAADSILYNNKHKCTIWNAFARRGMGYSASEGSSDSCGDETVAFDVPPCTLPVTLIDFSGALNVNKVQLKWITTSEVNTNGYEVEYSTTGSNWSSIGFVAAKNTINVNNYAFTHLQPQIGANYYRLKIIDKDGSFKYSKTVEVNYSLNRTMFSIYPNPVKETLTAEVYKLQAEKVNLKIVDVTGRTIQSNQVQTQVGDNVFHLNTNNLAKGAYFIVLEGESREVKQFIKQ
jgi:hypothetical protein